MTLSDDSMFHGQVISYKHENKTMLGKFFSRQDDLRKAVLLFPAFEGISPFCDDYAKNLWEQGYSVFIADIYGDGKVAETLDECFELITPFLNSRDLVRKRSLLAFEELRKLVGLDTKIGALGFCFGGMCLLELARSGAALTSGVVAHGVLKKSSLTTHQVLSKFLFLQGYADPQVSWTELGDIAKELEEARCPDWSVHFFGKAMHSFTDPRTGSFDAEKEEQMGRRYDRVAAQRTFRYALDFFEETLTTHDVKKSS